MHTRRLAVTLALPLVLAATSCSSDDEGGKSGSPSAAATSKDVKALVSKIRAAVAPLKSAHFDLTASISGQQLTGSGDEKLAAGKLTALRADATIPSGVGAVSIVVLHKRYAKLPPPFATRSKPWLVVSKDSNNAVVSQLSGVLDAAIAASSLESLSDVASATTALRKIGSSGGTTHYTLTVDPARLSGNGGARTALGGKPIPVQLYVDGSGRPVKVQVKVNILGQPTNTTVTFSRFDAPVTITAPPGDQVSGG